MTLANQKQLQNARAKLKLLEEKHAELLAEPGESIATRKLTLQSLERWMKKLKEEIPRYECEDCPSHKGDKGEIRAATFRP